MFMIARVVAAIGGRVGQTGVEEAGRLQVEEFGDMLGAVVLEGRALDDGQDARLAGFGLIAPLYGDGVDFPVRVHVDFSSLWHMVILFDKLLYSASCCYHLMVVS